MSLDQIRKLRLLKDLEKSSPKLPKPDIKRRTITTASMT